MESNCFNKHTMTVKGTEYTIRVRDTINYYTVIRIFRKVMGMNKPMYSTCKCKCVVIKDVSVYALLSGTTKKLWLL